jgi:predicted molibdopterin-dependent oxidoreductase YjgC
VSTVQINMDGESLEVTAGQTILDAAKSAGIYIPHLCNSDGLKPYGACRMCIVEVDGMRGMPTSCSIQVAEGMVIRTDTEKLNAVRRMICEMLITDHPLTCLSCKVNQRCELQTVAAHLGVSESRLRRLKRKSEVDESNPFYERDLSKCILCGVCVRACDELRGVSAIDIAGRGYDSRIAAFGDSPVRESTCESCGECVDRCPVGALSAKSESIPPTREVTTICPYCGCGCALVLGTRNGRIVSVRGDADHPTSHGSLCVKGRFGLDFVSAEDRLTKPLIRRDGKLEEAEWEEALELVASKIGAARDEHGPDSVAGLASAKCTNEENYVFQKLMRAAVGTNNVDHCARL